MSRAMKPVVLITGCSRGIGHACALGLAARGWTVVATTRGPQGRDALQAAGVQLATLDVRELPATRLLVASIQQRLGRLDAVVVNAGYGLQGCFEDLDPYQIRAVFDVNVFGAMNTVRACLPALRAAGGRVVLISSVAGLRGAPGSSAYSASKFALEGWAEALRFELRPLGVRVVLVEPGATDTGFVAARRQGPRVGTGAYAAVSARIAQLLLQSAASPDSPDVVVDAVVASLERAHPPLRAVTGRSARSQALARRVLPWRVYEWAVSRKLKLPRS